MYKLLVIYSDDDQEGVTEFFEKVKNSEEGAIDIFIQELNTNEGVTEFLEKIPICIPSNKNQDNGMNIFHIF